MRAYHSLARTRNYKQARTNVWILLAGRIVGCGAITPRIRRRRSGGIDGVPPAPTRTLAWFGDLAAFCARVVRAMFTRPLEWEEFLRQLDSVGAKSFGLVALAGAATGVVLSMQTLDSLRASARNRCCRR